MPDDVRTLHAQGIEQQFDVVGESSRV